MYLQKWLIKLANQLSEITMLSLSSFRGQWRLPTSSCPNGLRLVRTSRLWGKLLIKSLFQPLWDHLAHQSQAAALFRPSSCALPFSFVNSRCPVLQGTTEMLLISVMLYSIVVVIVTHQFHRACIKDQIEINIVCNQPHHYITMTSYFYPCIFDLGTLSLSWTYLDRRASQHNWIPLFC